MSAFERTPEELSLIAAMENREEPVVEPPPAPPGPIVAPVAPAAKPKAYAWEKAVIIKEKPYTLSSGLKALGDKYPSLQSLIDMLTYCRPAWSRGDKRLIGKYIWPLGARPDKYGNFWLRVPPKNPDAPLSRILWSCHTDTVHSRSGFQPLYLNEGSIASLSGDCLGADCTTGVWLMIEMIKAGVPGTYVFHRGEERGGQGSSYIQKNMGPYLKENFDYAIAFDRRGDDSVITHQGGRLGASDAFVASIVPMLPGRYKADSGGTFTDTANYVEHIKECTNLSIGYFSQHMPTERQDVAHAVLLRAAMLDFDESKLVAARDPSKKEYYSYGGDYDGYSHSSYGHWEGAKWVSAWDKSNSRTGTNVTKFQTAAERRSTWDRDYYHPLGAKRLDSIEAIVKAHPERVADWLEQNGYDPVSLAVKIGLNASDVDDPNDELGI